MLSEPLGVREIVELIDIPLPQKDTIIAAIDRESAVLASEIAKAEQAVWKRAIGIVQTSWRTQAQSDFVSSLIAALESARTNEVSK